MSNNLTYKKDIYASTGTAVICGLILLLMLWLKLVTPVKIEEQGIEVGYGVDLEGDVGGSTGGSTGNFAGEMDGSFDAKKIEVPSFSEKPAAVAHSIASTTQATSVNNNDFAVQSDESDVAVTSGSKVDKKAAEDAARIQAAQEQQQVKADKARASVSGAFENSGISGGTGSGGVGNGSGTGSDNGAGTGGGIGDSTGSGTRGNPLGSGISISSSLQARGLVGDIAKPQYNQNVEGKITVNIRVDENGNVTSTDITSPTTIADETLRTATLQSARKTKFKSGNGIVYGKIEYNFKLK